MSYKNEDYLNAIREKPCIVCQVSKRSTGLASEAHHEHVLESNKYDKRNNDYSAVPLCRIHHEQRHAVGFDVFWQMVGDYLGENTTPFFIAASMVALYLTDFLEKITNDLDSEQKSELLGEVSAKMDEVFGETPTDGEYNEANLRKMLEILSKYAHEQYTMRYRNEVN